MKKCIVCSDSFKGTVSSIDICKFAKFVIPKFFPECELITIPMADGGEGSVDCVIEALGAEPVTVEVSGPYMEKIHATYAVYGDSAIIEMASAAGLPLVKNHKNPLLTTTYGVGELILDAVNTGCRRIYLGLGGSSTNDAGCGCAAALGAEFFNHSGRSFVPTGATLSDIFSLDISKVKEKLEGIEMTVMCDVDNPMYGLNGAANVFGPQKGADAEMIKILDAGLENFCKIVRQTLDIDLTFIPGSGAAGGMGGGAIALLGGTLCSGIEAILSMTKFDQKLEGADLVITGEGRLDDQSFRGKVISGILSRTLQKEIPVFAIVGNVGTLTKDPIDYGISAVFETNKEHRPMNEVEFTAARDYRAALEDAMRYQRILERHRI